MECVGLVGCRVTVFCGLGVASYPQLRDRSQHGCTVGIDRDPPEVPELQLLRTSVLVLVLLYTWWCLVVVVLPCRTVCHPQHETKNVVFFFFSVADTPKKNIERFSPSMEGIRSPHVGSDDYQGQKDEVHQTAHMVHISVTCTGKSRRPKWS